jgi:hypothetical protein
MNENFTTSSEPFSVRRFEPRDREAVLNLWPADVMHSEPGSETVDVLIDSIEGAIAGEHHVWVAEARRRALGYRRIPSRADSHRCSYFLRQEDARDRWHECRLGPGINKLAVRDGPKMKEPPEGVRAARAAGVFQECDHFFVSVAFDVASFFGVVFGAGGFAAPPD